MHKPLLRQARKQLARATHTPFHPIIGQLHSSGMNHASRRKMVAGKNPRVAKGGTNWRVKHWRWGVAHPRNTEAGREARA